MGDEDSNISRDEETENSETQDAVTEETTETETETTAAPNDNSTDNTGAENEARFARLESTLERVLGEISAIREAQGILVENGAVISETGLDLDFPEEDGFIPPKELDLLI